MTTFSSLMRRADTLKRGECDPIKREWWTGYMRGLRRAHHGEHFGSQAEHDTWQEAAGSDDPLQRALGAGYIAGLTLEPRDPPDVAAPEGADGLLPRTVIAAWRDRMRLQHGSYSQRQAAQALGMSLSGYQAQERGARFEDGKPRAPSRALLLACAAIEHGIEPIE